MAREMDKLNIVHDIRDVESLIVAVLILLTSYPRQDDNSRLDP